MTHWIQLSFLMGSKKAKYSCMTSIKLYLPVWIAKTTGVSSFFLWFWQANASPWLVFPPKSCALSLPLFMDLFQLAKGMDWLVKFIKITTKLLRFAIQTGKHNLIGSHTTKLCFFASHQKIKLNPFESLRLAFLRSHVLRACCNFESKYVILITLFGRRPNNKSSGSLFEEF